MKRKTRRLFFIFLVGVFIVLGSSIVMYARGWTIDFSTLKPTKVGAIFIKVSPPEAKIYLNNRQVKSRSSWPFQSGIFINNLPPKTYKLTLFSPGYKDWQSNIKVRPSFVTEIKSAVLVPIKEEIASLEKIKDFWLIDEIIIFQDLENNIKESESKIAGDKFIDFSNTGEILTYDEKSKSYFLTNIKSKKTLNIDLILKKINPFFAKDIEKIFLDKTDGTPIIQKKNGLYLLDISKNKLNLITSSTASYIQWGDSSRFWLGWIETDKKNNSSKIVAYDKFLKIKNISDETIANGIEKMEWFSGNKIAFLQKNGELFFYDILSKTFTKIADDVLDFKFNYNQTMLAARGSKDLEIFSLKNTNDYRRIPLEKATEIKNIIWYKDNYHLFIEYPHKIVFLDIDKNYQKEPTEIARGSSARYNTNLNRLYFLKDNKLWKMDFPE